MKKTILIILVALQAITLSAQPKITKHWELGKSLPSYSRKITVTGDNNFIYCDSIDVIIDNSLGKKETTQFDLRGWEMLNDTIIYKYQTMLRKFQIYNLRSRSFSEIDISSIQHNANGKLKLLSLDCFSSYEEFSAVSNNLEIYSISQKKMIYKFNQKTNYYVSYYTLSPSMDKIGIFSDTDFYIYDLINNKEIAKIDYSKTFLPLTAVFAGDSSILVIGYHPVNNKKIIEYRNYYSNQVETYDNFNDGNVFPSILTKIKGNNTVIGIREPGGKYVYFYDYKDKKFILEDHRKYSINDITINPNDSSFYAIDLMGAYQGIVKRTIPANSIDTLYKYRAVDELIPRPTPFVSFVVPNTKLNEVLVVGNNNSKHTLIVDLHNPMINKGTLYQRIKAAFKDNIDTNAISYLYNIERNLFYFREAKGDDYIYRMYRYIENDTLPSIICKADTLIDISPDGKYYLLKHSASIEGENDTINLYKSSDNSLVYKNLWRRIPYSNKYYFTPKSRYGSFLNIETMKEVELEEEKRGEFVAHKNSEYVYVVSPTMVYQFDLNKGEREDYSLNYIREFSQSGKYYYFFSDIGLQIHNAKNNKRILSFDIYKIDPNLGWVHFLPFFTEDFEYVVYYSVYLGCFKLDLSTSDVVEDNTLQIPIKLFPMPADNSLQIQSDNAGIDDIRIYDISGQLLIQKHHYSDSSIDVSSLSNGNYILKISINGLEITKPFIISR